MRAELWITSVSLNAESNPLHEDVIYLEGGKRRFPIIAVLFS